MSDEAERKYYMRRSAAERALAEQAKSNGAAILHFELAEHYADLASGKPMPSQMPLRT